MAPASDSNGGGEAAIPPPNKRRYQAEATMFLNAPDNRELSPTAIINSIEEVCGVGTVFACVQKAGNTYECVLADSDCVRVVRDGVEIGDVQANVREFVQTSVVVSFLRMCPLVGDDQIVDKLNGLGVEVLGEINRRTHKGSHACDGTRFVRVRFPPEVKSLPYSMKFWTGKAFEYVRVLHNDQVKVCSGCMSDSHLYKDCPEFTCHRCGEQGHMRRSCQAVKCRDCRLYKCECDTFVDNGVRADESEGRAGEASRRAGGAGDAGYRVGDAGSRAGDVDGRVGDAGGRAGDVGDRVGDAGGRAGCADSRVGDAGCAEDRVGDAGDRVGDAGDRVGDAGDRVSEAGRADDAGGEGGSAGDAVDCRAGNVDSCAGDARDCVDGDDDVDGMYDDVDSEDDEDDFCDNCEKSTSECLCVCFQCEKSVNECRCYGSIHDVCHECGHTEGFCDCVICSKCNRSECVCAVDWFGNPTQAGPTGVGDQKLIATPIGIVQSLPEAAVRDQSGEADMDTCVADDVYLGPGYSKSKSTGRVRSTPMFRRSRLVTHPNATAIDKCETDRRVKKLAKLKLLANV